MALEFKPDQPDYSGKKEWTNGAEIKDVKILTEDLPRHIDTIPFQPFYSQKDFKYAIMVDIKVSAENLSLTGQVRPPHTITLSHAVIESNGLRVVLMTFDGEPGGKFWPKIKN